MSAGDIFTIGFYAVLGAVVIGFSVRSWRRTLRSRRAETPEQLKERRLREYERGSKGGPAKPWIADRDTGLDREAAVRAGAAVDAGAAISP